MLLKEKNSSQRLKSKVKFHRKVEEKRQKDVYHTIIIQNKIDGGRVKQNGQKNQDRKQQPPYVTCNEHFKNKIKKRERGA